MSTPLFLHILFGFILTFFSFPVTVQYDMQ